MATVERTRGEHGDKASDPMNENVCTTTKPQAKIADVVGLIATLHSQTEEQLRDQQGNISGHFTKCIEYLKPFSSQPIGTIELPCNKGALLLRVKALSALLSGLADSFPPSLVEDKATNTPSHTDTDPYDEYDEYDSDPAAPPPPMTWQQALLHCANIMLNAQVAIETPRATVDIKGDLPDALYTMVPFTIAACMFAGGVDPAAFMLCRKTFLVRSSVASPSLRRRIDGAQFIVLSPRLFACGNNTLGQCTGSFGRAWVDRPLWIRVPPVGNAHSIYYGYGSTFAITKGGVYSWGSNLTKKLGRGDLGSQLVTNPGRVKLPAGTDTIHVHPMDWSTFFQTTRGWYACGANGWGQLGLGHDDKRVVEPAPIHTPFTLTGVFSRESGTWFLAGNNRVLACGKNIAGRLGINDTTGKIRALTEVDLPLDRSSGSGDSVETIVADGYSCMFVTNRGTWVCGSNKYGALGLDGFEETVPAPRKLSFDVTSAVLNAGSSAMLRSDGAILVGGNNSKHHLPGSDRHNQPVMEADLPFSVTELVLGKQATFIRRKADGAWFARGLNSSFRLGVPGAAVVDWSRVPLPNDEFKQVWSEQDYTIFLSDDDMFVAGHLSGIGLSQPGQTAPRRLSGGLVHFARFPVTVPGLDLRGL
ncbi:endodeoxyribonuclease RusA family protein [Carpediemonas membranifera]|uniref:Endodeoxyribonuclease RusA family protein n=1 Tax=Carpediemonas membranifera TaxID=201153 RepID=A0A8J6BE09_9EUKA|nr:endodeoxyribonuclease RusA family protein [Carpediemonas membranifera]|eukprot:KAG9395517.1 endodeoxyribonuclease RusA family protein [Carpediemonas membranifera]